jgi:prepilin-type N-terminal cleavage/methylation domain-containing protein
MRRHGAAAGFSLIELMVVLVMLGIVTSQILSILATQMNSYAAQKGVTETQGDARLAVDLMVRDIRMAGYMVPEENAVSGIDGGTGAADVLCLSDPSVMNDAQVDLALSRFDGASLTANVGGGDNSVTLNAADLDIDGDGDVDFTVGSGIIIASNTNTYCGRISAINSGVVSFAPATAGSFAVAVGAGVAVPAIFYARTGAGLIRNSLVVSRQIEDLQVEYAVDANDDGQIGGGEFPVHGLSGQNPGLVRGLRLSVLARSIDADPQITGTGRPGVANRNPSGTPDAFRRRLVRVVAAPRNLLQ